MSKCAFLCSDYMQCSCEIWDPTNTYIHLTYRKRLLTNSRLPHGKPRVLQGRHMLKDEIFLDLCIHRCNSLYSSVRDYLHKILISEVIKQLSLVKKIYSYSLKTVDHQQFYFLDPRSDLVHFKS